MVDQLLSPKVLGYWTFDQLSEVPDESGVYCVFRAAKDPETAQMEVQELLYVGEHRNARHALRHHADRQVWEAFLQQEEELWIAMGLCGYVNRERLTAAMINAHKPRFNQHSPYLEHFPFDKTMVHLYGKKEKLQTIFTVARQELHGEASQGDENAEDGTK